MDKYLFIGFMCSGKSVVSKKFSKFIGATHIDSDELIIKKCNGRTISDIFQVEGEEYFRNLEAESINEILANQQVYSVATGGGVPENSKAMQFIHNSPSVVVIYLRADFNTILDRVKVSGTANRPLFSDVNRAKELYERRLPIYESIATYIIDVDGLSVNDIAWKAFRSCS